MENNNLVNEDVITFCENSECQVKIINKAGDKTKYICNVCELKIQSMKYDIIVCDSAASEHICQHFMLIPNGTGRSFAVSGCICKKGNENTAGNSQELPVSGENIKKSRNLQLISLQCNYCNNTYYLAVDADIYKEWTKGFIRSSVDIFTPPPEQKSILDTGVCISCRPQWQNNIADDFDELSSMLP